MVMIDDIRTSEAILMLQGPFMTAEHVRHVNNSTADGGKNAEVAKPCVTTTAGGGKEKKGKPAPVWKSDRQFSFFEGCGCRDTYYTCMYKCMWEGDGQHDRNNI
jgi:hypothetical protein